MQDQRVGCGWDITRMAHHGLDRTRHLAEGEAEDIGAIHDEVGVMGPVAFGIRAFGQ